MGETQMDLVDGDAQEKARDHAPGKPERASPLALLVGRFPHPGTGPPSHL